MDKLIFCNGGDRKVDENNIFEYKICKELGIEMVDGLGEKIRSSSVFTGLIEYDE
jgi:D-beta-D-heptose 7-phosphate kinase/D-beta-D-heptose 1-phosphate adenosyltransferase